jgi:hypothetical protein
VPQELSVWSASSGGADSAPDLGAPAASLFAGYRLARRLIEAAGALQDMHGTLQVRAGGQVFFVFWGWV